MADLSGGAFAERNFVVDGAWLEAQLGAPDLVILDCTVVQRPNEANTDMVSASGRPLYEAGHIPGSVHLDAIRHLSRTDTALRFMLPPPAAIAAVFAAHGVGEGRRVVLYDRLTHSWAARTFFTLRAIGFEDAAVLNGGWTRWLAEGRPVSTTPAAPRPATLVARPRPGLFVDKEAVRAAMNDPGTVIVNSLSTAQHEGRGGVAYGRAGRIPGSRVLPAALFTDAATGGLAPLDAVAPAAAAAGAVAGRRAITYCGAGVAASAVAFGLLRLGVRDLGIYDASLQEWARDPDCPMVAGPQAPGMP
ncbi:MAG: sulfurtransferase [Alphaproteobacteria bacterium]|nr:sulfurtransferase [Alphaproteobacteria bacterium]